ncbi:MAG: hypothetical protein ABWX83_03165 [Luteibacter sp.]
MAEGFRTKDPVSGAVLVTLDTHLTKVLGFFNTGVADGSIADASLAKGTPFVAVLPGDGTTGKVVPTVTVSSSGVSWSWAGNPPAASRVAVDLTYGFWT